MLRAREILGVEIRNFERDRRMEGMLQQVGLDADDVGVDTTETSPADSDLPYPTRLVWSVVTDLKELRLRKRSLV